jgi:hypothetical protein
MEPDNFEQQLERQKIRQVPEAWRDEILSAAQQAYQTKQSPSFGSWRTTLYSLKEQVLALLWPSPKAWAALAAGWLLIAVVNVQTSDRTIAVGSQNATKEFVTSWKEQERLLSEVIGAKESPEPVAENPKPAPRRRSEQKGSYRII